MTNKITLTSQIKRKKKYVFIGLPILFHYSMFLASNIPPGKQRKNGHIEFLF